MKTEITPQMLRAALRYDPETGKLFWRERTEDVFKDERYRKAFNTKFAGAEALTAETNTGYKRGRVFNQCAYAHRVIWVIVHGKWPDGQIDHINGVRTDNRLSNLRDVSPSINQRNGKLRSNNTSGYNGVKYDKSTGLWRAYIKTDGPQKDIGSFNSAVEAAAMRKKAELGNGFTRHHGLARIQTGEKE